MTVTTLPYNNAYARTLSANKPAPAPQDAPISSQGVDEDKVTWGQAFTGLGAAVAVAGIETVGNTASSIINAPKATYHAYKALFATPQLGPVIKTCIALTLPAAVIAAPVLTALGSAGFGLYRGFTEGIENGFGGAVKQGVEDVKTFHTDLAGKLVKELQEYETDELEPGEEPFDISIAGGAKGLAAGATAGVVDGLGIGAVTLLHTPRALFKCYDEMWSSEASLPLKVVGSALLPVAAVIATPLGLVGGAVYGIATGAYKGYTKGYGEAVSSSVDVVKDYNQMVDKALDDM
ncbi:MAG: hypothetical protein AB7S38_20335 [Vulcanimicrobiota bacterium]